MYINALLIFYKKYPRYIWLTCYLIINTIYFFIILSTQKLRGESNVIPIVKNTPVVLIFSLLIGSYFYICVYLFKFLDKYFKPGVKNLTKDLKTGALIGWLILILQILFFGYFMTTGNFLAGSIQTDSNRFSYIWVLISTDSLFYIYYGFYRESKVFKLNLVVWIISSFARGWSGVLLTMLFMESCRLLRENKLKFLNMIYSLLILFIIYPLVLIFKLLIRQNLSENLWYSFFNSNFLGFSEVNSFDGVLELIGISLAQLFDRLHLLSSAISAYLLSDNLSDNFYSGSLIPFWLEGIHGSAIYRLLNISTNTNLGVALAKYMDPAAVDVNWNTNPTILGWIFVVPEYSLFYIIYIILLCTFSLFFMKRISNTEEAKDMIWYAWLVFLIPGWIGAFVLFVYSLAVFYILFLICNYVNPIGRTLAIKR